MSQRTPTATPWWRRPERATLRRGTLVYWHLPSSVDARAGDVLVVRERALRLISRCGPHHRAVLALRNHMLAFYDHNFASNWLARRQVWSARVLDHTERRKLVAR